MSSTEQENANNALGLENVPLVQVESDVHVERGEYIDAPEGAWSKKFRRCIGE